MRSRGVWAVCLTLLVLGLTSVVTGGVANAAPPPVLRRLSTSPSGVDPNDASRDVGISHDGSVVVFDSFATNLVSPAPAASPAVYAVGIGGGPAELISVNDAGQSANAYAQGPATAGNGRFVVFQSAASNLVAYSGPVRSQIYLRDRVSHTTELVSVNSAGVPGNNFSSNATVSADGRYVAFSSQATNLGGTPAGTVYLRDRLAGITTQIPVAAPAGALVYNQVPRISDDGSVVVFTSQTLSATGTALTRYRTIAYNTTTGISTQADVSSAGAAANRDSAVPSVSGTGRYVLFSSGATNLLTTPVAANEKLYMHDLITGATTLVSTENVSNGRTAAIGTVSDDGRYATYLSESTALGALAAVVHHDLVSGTVTTVANTDSQLSNVFLALQDGDGQRIVFVTSDGLDPADHNDTQDVYVQVPADIAPPMVTGQPNQAANAAGWSPIGTTITWTAVDPDPSSGTPTTPPPTVVTAEGANQTITSAPSCDPAGNCATGAYTISVDATPPTLAATTTDQANAAGWFHGDVTYHWACTDALSGIGSGCPAASVITGEGTALTAAAVVTDNAGNAATAMTPAVNIDRTAPVTTADSPAGWSNHAVVVQLTASDNLSGVDHTTYQLDGHPWTIGDQVAVSGDGLHTLDYLSVDVAGNVEPTQHTIVRVDTTGPSIAVASSPPPNAAGWNNSAVTVTATCTDALSEVASCSNPITFNSEGAHQSALVSGTDGAGNTTTVGVTLNVDLTAPTVTVIGPAAGARYVLGSQPTPSCSSSDNLSGVATPASVTTSQSAGGAYTAICSAAIDAAGNTGESSSVSYTVLPAGWTTVKVVDSTGAPWPGVPVSLKAPTGATTTGTTDTGGSFGATLAPGGYSVTAWVAGGYQTKTVTVTAAGPNTVLFATVPVTVQIADPSTADIAAASVAHAGNTGSFGPKTAVDATGQVVFQALPGTSSFTAWVAGGYQTKSTTVTAAGPNTVSFATVAVTITVTRSGAPLTSAAVSHAGNTGSFGPQSPVDANGQVVFQTLPGTNSFTAWSGSIYSTATFQVTGLTSATITLP